MIFFIPSGHTCVMRFPVSSLNNTEPSGMRTGPSGNSNPDVHVFMLFATAISLAL
jgi:hypothetical protein